MDNNWLLIIGAIAAFVVVYWYMNRRQRPQGSYDDEDVRSSGSIGGSRTRAYDDEDVRSSGSIGGSEEGAYDDDEYRSGGSIGG